MSEWFLLFILKTIHHKVSIFHILVGLNQLMSTIDFEVTRSKVKVKVTLKFRIVSADYFKNYSLHSIYILHTDWS
jgi:hypothetical protein